jgi:hypothetical protein
VHRELLNSRYSWTAIRPFVADCTPATNALVREQPTFGGKAGAAELAGYINMRIDVIIVRDARRAGARQLHANRVDGQANHAWRAVMSSTLAMLNSAWVSMVAVSEPLSA